MRKKRSICLVLLCWVPLSCSPEQPGHPSTVDLNPIPGDLRISLSTAGAKPPYYIATVDADGRVEFYGLAHTNVKGEAQDAIDIAKVRRLLEAFEDIDFQLMPDRYDFPRDERVDWLEREFVKIGLLANGQWKSVVYDDGPEGTVAPASLMNLRNQIDEVLETEQWIYE